MKQLLSALRTIGDLPQSEAERFVALARRNEIAKGEYFIQEGRETNRLGYVERGLFQNLCLTEKGVACTFGFSAENDFLYECQAMRTFAAAHYSIQAIENSVVWTVDYRAWVAPFRDSVWWNKLLLDLTTLESAEKSEREIRLMSLTGRERYTHFRERYSHLEHRIKQHMIAAYLGISPVSLSRIRREMGLIS